MSRGRGGAPRGPRAKAGTTRIGGMDIAYDEGLEESLRSRPQPTPLFPPYNTIPPRPLSRVEKGNVSKTLALRTAIHEGPLYTKLGSGSAGVAFDPFEGMPPYSQKYVKRRRRLPRFDTRPHVLKFFPKELWSTLGPPPSAISSTTNGSHPKTPTSTSTLPTGPEHNGTKSQHGPLNDLSQIHEDDDDAGGEQADEDQLPPEEEEVDDSYDEDEEEMGGDYNAEQYFDDGGDDAGDDYDAGDGDGGDYM